MIRDILRMGDQRLLEIAKPVLQSDFDTDALNKLVDDMFDTMSAAQGVGLAAPQIGVNLQLFVFGFESGARAPNTPAVPRTVLCNPVVLPLTKTQEEDWEGCLSIPGLRGMVPRCIHIRYFGQDIHGQQIEGEARGFHARVIQHEYDHLIGQLYPARIKNFDLFGYNDILFPDKGF